MKIVKVTYTTKTEYSEQNQHNIKNVMNELRELNHPDLFYHVCLNPDGKTFTHTAFFKSDGDQQLLLTLPAFKSFEQQLRANGLEVPPRQELLNLVGSSKEFFTS